MLDACYYSLIDRQDDGGFLGWVPDLPGVMASGRTEDEVVKKLFADARDCLHNMIMSGQSLPPARPVAELPQDPSTHRRLLLMIS